MPKKVARKIKSKKQPSAPRSMPEVEVSGELSNENIKDNTKSNQKSSPVKEEIPHWFKAMQSNDDDLIKKSISKQINQIISDYGLENYALLFLYDPNGSIENYDLDKLYKPASLLKKQKDVLLLLHSGGGSIEPAYLISKALKSSSKEKFVTVVPRRAKSAATLVCLGADEIHMGLTSQLGPIDPQIGGLPALGLINALDTLAGLAAKFPEASKMLSDYLQNKLDLNILGYFNRVTESAVQYGERLLSSKKFPNGRCAQEVADHLVNHYKDHSFVIDIDEALGLLGENIIKVNTKEYQAANEIYEFFDFLNFLFNKKGKKYWYVGDVDNGMVITTKK